MKLRERWIVAGALVASLALAVDVVAQPRTPGERKEDRKERREDRREDRKDRRQEVRQEWKDKHKAWVENRPKRREEAVAKVKERWGKAIEDAATREELRVHARRTARLDRALDLATETGNEEAKAKAEKLIAEENARHDARMAEIAKKAEERK